MSSETLRRPEPTATVERWRRLEDESAIRRLVARFGRHLDDRDWSAYASLYAPDATLTLPHGEVQGRAEIERFVAVDLGRYARTHHAGGLQDITVDGDRAVVFATLLAVHATSADGREFWSGGGWYELHLRRLDGLWLIQSTDARPVWLVERGASPSAPPPPSLSTTGPTSKEIP